MTDLKTTFAGLSLRNPIIISSSGLTNSVGKNKKLAEDGAGAIVLKSLFEEQIMLEAEQLKDPAFYPEGSDYLAEYIREHKLSEYLTLIKESTKVCPIPIIASINCYSDSEWVDFAKQIEEAGADAIEINILALQSDVQYTYGSFEQRHIDILRHIKRTVSIPVIYTAVTDPVAAELANADGTPVGEVTGTSDKLPVEQQLEMIRAILPDAKKIGIMYTTSEVNSASTLAEYKEKAADYGFEIVESGVSSTADIPLAADSLLEQVDCLNNLTDNTVVASLPLILSKANAKNIPVFGSEIEQVKIGCLAAMGLDYVDLGKQTGRMAAEVLKGEKKASELNFEVIETAAFYGNSKVAEDLGITFPEDLASNAKELFTEITQ